MKTKNPVAAASLTLCTLGLLGVAAASGCSSAPDAPVDAPDAAVTLDASVDSADPDGTPLEAGACAPDTADCDGDPRNGCETKVSTDPKNCGACKHDCTGLPHVSGATTCSAGKCIVPATSCAMGYGHCSTRTDDGCEADLTKPATCGNCSTSCSGSTSVCANGSCSSGCPSNAPTQCSGSCVDTTQSATNCATCGHACTSPAHGQATCASSACGFACNSGYHTCGAGCADNTDPMTCGSSCTPCAAPANGVATCDGTTCGSACNIGFHACGATCVSDSDATACGASCTACSAPGGAGHATCTSNACGVACDSGNHLCGSNCASNADTATCGTSCTPCALPANAQSTTCNGATCGFTCNTGYADCDGNAANGCEVNLATDGTHCGSCTHDCLGGACSANACQPSIVATIANATAMAIDTATIYVAGGSSVFTVPKSGGTAQLLDRGVGSVRGVAIDASNAYWTDTNGRIMRTAKVGSANQVLYQYSGSEIDQPSGVAVTGGRVYWISSNSGIVAGGSVATDGTNAQLKQFAGGITLSPYAGTKVYAFTNGAFFLGEIRGASFGLFGYSNNVGVNVDTSGGVATDGTYVYYTESTEIHRVLWSGANDVRLAANLGDVLADIVLDGSNLYWADSTNGTIASMPSSGGTPKTLASGQSSPLVILTDSAAIYWINSGNGRLMKLAK